MTAVNIIAIFTPAPGKVHEVRELLAAQSLAVHQNEDYATRFIVTEQLGADPAEFCLFETYISKEAVDRHLVEPHFAELTRTLKERNLLAKPVATWQTRDVAGFDLDKKVILPA